MISLMDNVMFVIFCLIWVYLQLFLLNEIISVKRDIRELKKQVKNRRE